MYLDDENRTSKVTEELLKITFVEHGIDVLVPEIVAYVIEFVVSVGGGGSTGIGDHLIVL